MPSPYGGQRPLITVARSPSATTNASTRRDFPTPPTPSTVKRCDDWSDTARSNAPVSSESSRCLPTIGASSRRANPAAAGSTFCTRNAESGSVFPFTATGSSWSATTASRTSWYVSAPIRISPTPAACSRRAATFTASPAASVPSAAPVTTTSPVLIPTRMWTRVSIAPSSSTLRSPRASLSSAAARTARSASSSRMFGIPNTAITASPMNFSTVPPWRSMTPRIASQYRVNTPCRRSGSRRSPSAVDPTMSAKRIVTVRRAPACGSTAKGAPHAGQNEKSSGAARPQFRQRRTAATLLGNVGGPPPDTESRLRDQTEHVCDVGAHDAVELLVGDRRHRACRRLVVHRQQLVLELHGVVQEAGVVGAEEQLLERHEHRLATRQQQEQVAPADARDQIRELRVEVRVLGQQEQGLVHPRPARVRDDHAQIAERSTDIVEDRRSSELQARVDPGRSSLMDHHGDAELLRLLVDRERDLGIVRGPVLVHRVQLHAGQLEVDDRALELFDGGLRTLVRGVHRAKADQVLGVGAYASGDVVVAPLRVGRTLDAEDALGVDRSDEPAVEYLRRDGEDDALVEPGVVTYRLGRSDDRPAGPGEAARLPFLLGRHPMGRQRAHRAVDAQRALAAVFDGEVGVLGEGQDVAVRVDDHRAAPPSARFDPCWISASTPAASSTRTNASVALALISSSSTNTSVRSSITTVPSITTVRTARPWAANARCAYS